MIEMVKNYRITIVAYTHKSITNMSGIKQKYSVLNLSEAKINCFFIWLFNHS